MTKTHRKAATSAEDSFNRHYATIWGGTRWNESLRPALLQPTRYVCLLNRYAALTEAQKRIENGATSLAPLTFPSSVVGSTTNDVDSLSGCFVYPIETAPSEGISEPSHVTFPPPVASSNKLLSHWNLDAASVLVAHLLDIQPRDNVLDLCAAPGGKSIAIAQNLWPHLHVDDSAAKRNILNMKSSHSSTLHSNEVDGQRQRRLADNLKAYLPKSLFDTNQASALRVDGSKLNADNELRVKTPSGTVGYDKVLVDAPCSSERHIIHAHFKASGAGKIADEMATWRPGSSKRLASTQIDLLMTGLKAAEVGGTILYATCSIEPTENDGVIEKVLSQLEKDRKKRGLKWTVSVGFNQGNGHESLEAVLERDWAERTKYGWIVLPDHPGGGKWGPLFFAVLNKSVIAS